MSPLIKGDTGGCFPLLMGIWLRLYYVRILCFEKKQSLWPASTYVFMQRLALLTSNLVTGDKGITIPSPFKKNLSNSPGMTVDLCLPAMPGRFLFGHSHEWRRTEAWTHCRTVRPSMDGRILATILSCVLARRKPRLLFLLAGVLLLR